MLTVLSGWLLLSFICPTTCSEHFCLTKCRRYEMPKQDCVGGPCILQSIETGAAVFNIEECESICGHVPTETCEEHTATEGGTGLVYSVDVCTSLNSEEGMGQHEEFSTAANGATTADDVTASPIDFLPTGTTKPQIIQKCAKCRNPDLSHVSCFYAPDDTEQCPDGEACYIFPLSDPLTIEIEGGPNISMSQFEMCVPVEQVTMNAASVCKWPQCDLDKNFHEKGKEPEVPSTESLTTAPPTTHKVTVKVTTGPAVEGCVPGCTKVPCYKVTWTITQEVEYKCYESNAGGCGSSCITAICPNAEGPCMNELTTSQPTTLGNQVETTEAQDNGSGVDTTEDNEAGAVRDDEDSSSASLSHIKAIIIVLLTYLLRG